MEEAEGQQEEGRRLVLGAALPSITSALHFLLSVFSQLSETHVCLLYLLTRLEWGQLLTHFLPELGELVFTPGAVSYQMGRQVLGCEQIWAAGQRARWSLCLT